MLVECFQCKEVFEPCCAQIWRTFAQKEVIYSFWHFNFLTKSWCVERTPINKKYIKEKPLGYRAMMRTDYPGAKNVVCWKECKHLKW